MPIISPSVEAIRSLHEQGFIRIEGAEAFLTLHDGKDGGNGLALVPLKLLAGLTSTQVTRFVAQNSDYVKAQNTVAKSVRLALASGMSDAEIAELIASEREKMLSEDATEDASSDV